MVAHQSEDERYANNDINEDSHSNIYDPHLYDSEEGRGIC